MKKFLFLLWAVATAALLADSFFQHFTSEKSTFVSDASAGLSNEYKEIEYLDCSGGKFAADDGDSLYCDGNSVRIVGIDTPETMRPEYGIATNQPYGAEANAFVLKTLRAAGKITVVYRKGDLDRYGRLLGHVLVDGHLLAPMVIRQGLAYEMITRFGDQGFPEYAAEIMQAWNEIDKPLPFENPHDWRVQNINRVVDCSGSNYKSDDGDSMFCSGEEFRLNGLDTPEITHGKDKIWHDQKFGRVAADKGHEIMLKAKKAYVIVTGTDKYGRTLGWLFVDGELYASMMIKLGLAYETVTHYPSPRYPEFDRSILLAAKGAPLPGFIPPYLFRRCEQKGDCVREALMDRVPSEVVIPAI